MKKKKRKLIPFSKLSKAEQRVKVAKDVLVQLKNKKYIANMGAYIDGMDLENSGLKNGDNIKSNFHKIKSCKCCALGSCILSITKFKNTLIIGDVNSGKYPFYDNTKKLFKMFSPKQLLLIENSFEGKPEGQNTSRIGYTVFMADTTFEEKEKCRSFYLQYPDTELRLIAIMKNIIANKGLFILK